MTVLNLLRRSATFDALRDPHFRWYWIGMLASSATMQMGSVGQGWLVYELTGSAFALGWVSAAWSISNTILSPWGGVISDRLEKRTLLLWVRSLMALSSLTMSLLVALGVIQVWHIAAYSLFRGVLFAVLMPAQNAYLGQLVGREMLLNAVSLNSIGMGLAGIVSASVGGWMIEQFGVQAVYLTIGLLYVVVFLAFLKLPNTGTNQDQGYSVLADLREGARYIVGCPSMIPLLGLVFARGLLAMPYRTLMPKYAQDVMGLDATGLGVLVAAPGVGSLISSLVLASLGNWRGKGKLMLVSGVILGLALFGFASSQSFALVLVLLAVVGATSNICMVTNRTLLQVGCEAPYLGRVMSAYMMMFGLTQLGTMPIGAWADWLGVPRVIAILGAAAAITFVLVWVFLPKIRRLD